MERLVLREKLGDDAIRFVDVVGITTERNPPKRSLTLAEELGRM